MTVPVAYRALNMFGLILFCSSPYWTSAPLIYSPYYYHIVGEANKGREGKRSYGGTSKECHSSHVYMTMSRIYTFCASAIN